MTRSVARLVLVVAAALFVVSTGIAHADPPADQNEEEAHLPYPVSAAVFREHFAHRVAAARARMERHIVDAQLDQPKADALRARFQSALVQVTAKVDDACSDGTVTQQEAVAIHELAKSLRHHPAS